MNHKQVNPEPATMPIATQAPRSTYSSRANDRGRRLRANAWEEAREKAALEANLGRQVTAVRDEAQIARDRQITVHFVITLLTLGAWAPVWMYILIRNNRRFSRTPQGKLATRHFRSERARLASEQSARRKETQRAMRGEAYEEYRRLGRKLTGRGKR